MTAALTFVDVPVGDAMQARMRCDEPLARHTSFRIGGPADFGRRCGEDIADDERRYGGRREIPVEGQIIGAGVAGKV